MDTPVTTCTPVEGEVKLVLTAAYWRSLSIEEKQACFDDWYRNQHSALLANFALITGEKPIAFGRGKLASVKGYRDSGLDRF